MGDSKTNKINLNDVTLIDNSLEITIATDNNPPRSINHNIHFYKLESTKNICNPNKILVIMHGALACAKEYISVAYKFTDFYNKIYLIDIPGFGITKALPNQDLKKTAFSVYLILKKIKKQNTKLDLIGHSYGAYILQETLTTYPKLVNDVNKLVLVAVGSLYSNLHLRWYDAWRTYFWALFFKYQIVTKLVRLLARWLPISIWYKLIKYYPKLQLWQDSSEGEKLLANNIQIGTTCVWTKPCYSQIAALSKKLKLFLLWGTKDSLFIADIADHFAKKYNINVRYILHANHSYIGTHELKQILTQ